MSKKVKKTVLEPGPYATHFQEYRGDPLFKGTVSEKITFTQKPRVSLEDFLANRLSKITSLKDSEAEENS